MTSKNLDCQCHSVAAWCIIGDGAKHKNNDAKAAKATEAAVAGIEKRTRRDVVGVAPFWDFAIPAPMMLLKIKATQMPDHVDAKVIHLG